MGLAEFLSLLTEKKIYFSNMSAYEDIFEGMLVLEQIQERQDMKIGGYLEEHEQFRNEKKGVIINCWNQSEYENYHLWKNYDVSAGYGVAIKTNMKKLEASFSETKDENINELSVSYINYEPMSYMEVKDDLTKRIINKPKSYDSEKEVRIFKSNLDIDKYSNGHKFNINPSILIEEFITSPFAPKWFTMRLLCILKEFSDIEIRRLAGRINVSKIKI